MFSKLLFCSLLFLHSFYASHSLLFGLARLNRRFNHTTKIGARQKVLNSHKRMPRYMIQLYKELTTGDDGGFVKKKMPYQANAIRGINSAVSKPSKASMKIYFTLGYFHDRVTITRDELHLHMSPPKNPLDRNIFKPYILTLQDIHTNQLIREFKVPAFNQGWQVLSLKRWTNKWVKNPSSNKGVLLTIYRGRSKKLAHNNPFVSFPRGNDPYLILFASESVRSLVAWRFLIENALNSVAGTARSRVTRDISQQSQCTVVKQDMNLADTKIDDHRFIIEPKVYKMTKCSNKCITRPLFPSSSNRPRNTAIARYCCVPTRRRDLAVLIKDPTNKMVTFEILRNYELTNCKWAQQ